MKNTIIQWNCRGLRANYDELQLLLNDYDPAVVCLQETYLKEPNNVTFRNYNLFNTFAAGDGRGTGGVAIIINNKCPSSQIHLKNEYTSCGCERHLTSNNQRLLNIYST